jgi:hypothetical protein
MSVALAAAVVGIAEIIRRGGYNPKLRIARSMSSRRGTVMSQTSIPGTHTTLSELEKEIDDVRENIRELVEQAAGYSGAADDELASTRIAEQEARLALLMQERNQLSRKAT